MSTSHPPTLKIQFQFKSKLSCRVMLCTYTSIWVDDKVTNSPHTSMTNDGTVGVSTRCKSYVTHFLFQVSSSTVIIMLMLSEVKQREKEKTKTERTKKKFKIHRMKEKWDEKDLGAFGFTFCKLFLIFHIPMLTFVHFVFVWCLTFSRFNHRCRCGLFIVHLFFCFAPLSNYTSLFWQRLGDDNQSITIICLSEMTGRDRWVYDEYEIEIEIDCLSNGRRQQKLPKNLILLS